MIEVEAKVRLNSSDLKRVQRELKAGFPLKEKVIKNDFYYGKEKDFFIRIRESKDLISKKTKISLDLKRKMREKGMEMNPEISFPIRSRSLGHSLLRKMGLALTDKKQKHSTVYGNKIVSLELNRIPGLGDYLEIEVMVKTKKEIPAAKKKLTALFTQFGFSSNRWEHRYYLELLAEKR
ncbi:MAG: class IV adenylate cyclase [Candidatus Peregrinibacteria bacterium]